MTTAERFHAARQKRAIAAVDSQLAKARSEAQAATAKAIHACANLQAAAQDVSDMLNPQPAFDDLIEDAAKIKALKQAIAAYEARCREQDAAQAWQDSLLKIRAKE